MASNHPASSKISEKCILMTHLLQEASYTGDMSDMRRGGNATVVHVVMHAPDRDQRRTSTDRLCGNHIRQPYLYGTAATHKWAYGV